MTPARLLLSTWHWHPSVLGGCAILLVAYAGAIRGYRTPRIWLFAAGLLLLVIALLSPLHELGDVYLFSAHMLQHLLLLLVVPPLLLLGIPPSRWEQWLAWRPIHQIERVLGQPWIAWLLGLGAMWLWHLPLLYNAALQHQAVHIVEHLCFLVTATIFWWPVVLTGRHVRVSEPLAILYLFTAMLVSGVLGMLLTFARPGLYPAYLHPHDTLGLLPLLRGRWGLTPAVDQQVGGLLMWVPGSLVYLGAIIAMLARWYAATDEDGAVAPDYGRDTAHISQRRTTDVV